MMKKARLTGRKKSAILLALADAEISADIFRCLPDEEIHQLTLEIANLNTVPQDITAQVIEEFYFIALGKQYCVEGGVSKSREILEKAFGPGKAMEIIEYLQGTLKGTPFDFLRKVDPNYLLNIVQGEHPQVLALILSYLEYDQSAVILSALPPDLAIETAIRISTMEAVSPEIISEIERVLERKIATVLSKESTVSGGVEAIAEILTRTDRSTEKMILEQLEEENHELVTEIKKLMFTYDDLILLDDRAIQMVLREIDMKELAIGLKGASEEVKMKIFYNMSTRAADNLREDMEYMGPVRVKQVEEAQQKLTAIIRRMEEMGEIIILRGDDELCS